MNDREHRELRESLGGYVLGQLDDQEAAALEAHLDGCAECSAEYAELLPVAAALADVRQGQQERPSAVEAPPVGLGDRVLASVERAQSSAGRAGWLRAAGVAGVAAAAAAAVLVVGLQLTRPDPAPQVPLEAVTVTENDPQVAASADLVAHTWGVEVKLRASGFDEGQRYKVVVLGRDGRRFPAGEFVGTGDAEMNCNLNSSVLRDRAAGFEVWDTSGRVLVTSSFEG